MSEITSIRDIPRAPFRRRNRSPLLASLAVGVAAALIAASLLPPDDTPRPVVPTALEASGLGKLLSGGAAWRDLPFTLDAAERNDLAICLRLAGKVRSTFNGRSEFVGDDVRRQLEDVLARRPDFFYAEDLLGLWHAMNGDAARAGEYRARALDHAPVVLVQRYEFADGRPLAGARVPEFQVECNRVKKGALDPSLKLTFFDLTADADGCVRVPVYDTVYRLFNTTDPAGHDADYPRLGWFEAPGPVALLPPAQVRPTAR